MKISRSEKGMKKVIIKIFHSMKYFSRRENISPREKGHCLCGENLLMQSKHFTCLSHANFRDLVQVRIKVIPDPITSTESFMLYVVI